MRRRLFLAMALAGLSGCAGSGRGPGPGPGNAGLLRRLTGAHALRRLRLEGVTIAGPDGYCIDRRTRAGGRSGAFVALGPCASVTRDPQAPRGRAPAVLTASVVGLSQAPAPELSGLRRYFSTEAGRAVLARSGRAPDLELHGSATGGGALYLWLTDNSPGWPEALARSYRRAFVIVGDRLVTLSVLALRQRPLSDATARALVHDFTRAVQDANPTRNRAGNRLLALLDRLL